MWAVAAAAIAIALIWLFRINSAMEAVPPEVAQISPRRWSRQQIKDTYERVKQDPVSFLKKLPPRLDRRYVVVGGSGKHSIPFATFRCVCAC